MKIDLGALPARLGRGLQKLFGSANQRTLNVYDSLIEEVGQLGKQFADFTEEQVKERVAGLKEAVQSGQKTLAQAQPEMFALTRLASERTLGLRHYDVQMIGGAVLHDGRISEMATGEGKTLVATLPAALNALSGKGVYVVTVNDYLAKRDRDWMAPVFEYLGLTVGAIQGEMAPQQRHEEYSCDITYGTNNEFGFDYLRDNMKHQPEEQVQKLLNFAIVDEVDSILIDEARTPLIISGPPDGKADKFVKADRIARQLAPEEHFEVKLKDQSCLLTDAGIERAEKLAGVDSFYSDPANMDWPHLLECSLRAHHIYEIDKHYVKRRNEQSGEDEIIIVDEFTGRLMSGRRWSDGLHQAVEAKEGIPPKAENEVLATITLQNYFRMFDKLAGMTGTAMTEAAEFSRIYDLDVVAIPTNKPNIRQDDQDQIYLDESSKLMAVVEEVKEANAKGRPVLVGTTSIAKSESVSARLKEDGVEHDVLNAKHHEREAEIVAQAGRAGRVTVATNMAGRGTDIVLGGNPEAMWRREVQRRRLPEDGEEALALRTEFQSRCEEEQRQVLDAGGLFVIATERHEARRIDNQLRGRCARQGDPGQTKFFLCFDDDLMRIFARDWVRTMMEKLGLKEGERIESAMVSRGIARAQKKVEARNFDIRKHLIDYDEVMDKQRRFVYQQRQSILERDGLSNKVLGMFEDRLDSVLGLHAANKDEPINFDEIRTWAHHKCGADLDLEGLESVERENLFEWLIGRIEKVLEARQADYGAESWEDVQQFLLLNTIDDKWKDHLRAMEILKAGINLRSFAQVDPKNEYKKEGFEKFELLKAAIADHVTDLVFKVELRPADMALQAPAAPPPPPMDPATAQAMFEAMVSAGQVPPEVLEAVQRGATVELRPDGKMRVTDQPAAEDTGADGDAPPAEPQQGSAPAAPSAEADGGGAPAQAAPKAQPVAPPPGGVKPGRNNPCPCGSGLKYKKCCAPAFG